MPDRLVPGDPSGALTLEIMAAAPRYNRWMFDEIAPYLGRRILEVGSGIGNMSAHMAAAKPELLVLTDRDAFYRGHVAARFAGNPAVRVETLELPDAGAPGRFGPDRLDTVVALNVVEHIEDDVGALTTIRGLLAPEGRAVILVPSLPGIYGELDRELGHHRRYSRESLAAAFAAAGLRLVTMFWFNRAGVAGWWFNGRVRGQKHISLSQLKQFDALVPVLRFERFVPLPFGQSLIAIGAPG
jgi:SAM-dependent methyltransferase